MFKMVGLLKRRPGMSAQEFRDYYESKHRVIGEKYLAGYAVYYKRRFLQGFADPITGAEVEQDFDVLLEIGYKDEAAFAKANESFEKTLKRRQVKDLYETQVEQTEQIDAVRNLADADQEDAREDREQQSGYAPHAQKRPRTPGRLDLNA